MDIPQPGEREKVTSADLFFSEALTWFGDPDPVKGSPWDKGARLADLIRKKKTLLVLDGLEPLHRHTSTSVARSKILECKPCSQNLPEIITVCA